MEQSTRYSSKRTALAPSIVFISLMMAFGPATRLVPVSMMAKQSRSQKVPCPPTCKCAVVQIYCTRNYTTSCRVVDTGDILRIDTSTCSMWEQLKPILINPSYACQICPLCSSANAKAENQSFTVCHQPSSSFSSEMEVGWVCGEGGRSGESPPPPDPA